MIYFIIGVIVGALALGTIAVYLCAEAINVWLKTFWNRF